MILIKISQTLSVQTQLLSVDLILMQTKLLKSSTRPHLILTTMF